MGLGKTLMMLSTVLATLSQSYVFRETFCAYGNSHKQPSGATLVIAPSACQYISIFKSIEGFIRDLPAFTRKASICLL